MLFYWALSGISTLTIQLNGCMLAMFIRFHKRLLRSTHNRILCSMALGDCLVGVFGVNLGVLLLLNKERTYYKLLGNIPIFSSIFVSILSLILLTMDRLLAMKKPHFYTSFRYRKIVFKTIVMTWIIPGLIYLQQTVLLIKDTDRNNTELKIRSFLFTAFFMVGAMVLVWSNSLLFVGIRAYIKSLSEVGLQRGISNMEDSTHNTERPGEDIKTVAHAQGKVDPYLTLRISPAQLPDIGGRISPNTMPTKRMRCRLAKENEIKNTSLLCLLTFIVFICTSLPLAAYRFCYAIDGKIDIPWLRRLSLCLTITNSLLNPVLYLLVRKEFRAYLKRMILKCCCA